MTSVAFLLLLLSAPAAPTPSQLRSQTPAAYSIAGVIVDAVTGAPVSHAKLYVFTQNEELETTADESGRFRFQTLEPGKYPLSATAPGYVREAYEQHGAFFSGIVVGAGLDSEHLLFRLHPQGVIYGRVSDEHGDPVRHASVQLFVRSQGRSARQNWPRNLTQTDDLGEYRFSGLAAATYFLTVQAQPWYAQHGLTNRIQRDPVSGGISGTNWKVDPLLDVVYPLIFYPGVTDSRSASKLNVSAGSREEANIQLHAVPSVHVFFKNLPADENSSSPSGVVANPVNISASQKIFGSFAAGISTTLGQVSPGEFEVTGIPPGEVIFTIGAPGNQPNGMMRTFNATVVGGDTLDLAAAPPMVNVSGRVLPKPADADIEQFELTLVDDDDRSASSKLRKDATFSFTPVQAGTYKPYLRSPRGRHFIQQLSASGAKVHGTEVTFDGTHDAQLTITLVPGVGQITGVAQLDGKPKAGALVLLVPQSHDGFDDALRIDQSDSDGTFSLRNILPGKYWLMAIQDGWDLEWANPVVLQPFNAGAQVMQIAPDETKKMTVNVQRKPKNNSH